jgi:hypothetical protein
VAVACAWSEGAVRVCPKIMASLVGELEVCVVRYRCVVDYAHLSIICKRFAKCHFYE